MFTNFIFLTWECLGLLSAHKLPLECHWLQNISPLICFGEFRQRRSLSYTNHAIARHIFLKHSFLRVPILSSSCVHGLWISCEWSLDTQDLTSLCSFRKNHGPSPGPKVAHLWKLKSWSSGVVVKGESKGDSPVNYSINSHSHQQSCSLPTAIPASGIGKHTSDSHSKWSWQWVTWYQNFKW